MVVFWHYIVMTMSELPEPTLSTMDMFLLLAVGPGGQRTFYDLQKKLALQPGGIRPALSRLEQEGLLERAPAGKRRRREFRLTHNGVLALANQWKRCLSLDLDIHETLRAASIASLMGGVEESRQYLAAVARKRAFDAATRAMQASKLASNLKKSDLVSLYTWTRSTCEVQLMKGEQLGMEEVCAGLVVSSSNDPSEP